MLGLARPRVFEAMFSYPQTNSEQAPRTAGESRLAGAATARQNLRPEESRKTSLNKRSKFDE